MLTTNFDATQLIKSLENGDFHYQERFKDENSCENSRKIPILFMMCGIPASGKTAMANEIVSACIRMKLPITIYSSDDLREEMFGDVNAQTKNGELFLELHRRIKSDLRNGINTIYDATNINKKRRASFLAELQNIPCKTVCVCIMTPYECCLERNSQRERKVPDDVITRMYKSWQPPHVHEGFDRIHVIFDKDVETMNKYHISEFLSMARFFHQDNSHHELTLGEHCEKVAELIKPKLPVFSNIKEMYYAGLLHDCGKPFTKTRENFKGEFDGDYHYYNHHCVGAYDSMLYLYNEGLFGEYGMFIPNIIYFHMHPYLSWSHSERAKRRDRKMIGDFMYRMVMLLHECDKMAH